MGHLEPEQKSHLGLCEFCDEVALGTSNGFFGRYQHYLTNRVIWESSNLLIIPSIGQIVPGHVMIVPKTHVTAFADAPEETRSEVRLAKESLHSILFTRYGSSIFFEHGTRGTDCGGCGIYHAHLHAVPIYYAHHPKELVPEIAFEQAQTWEFALWNTHLQPSYLFFENSLGESFVGPVGSLPSQFLRRKLAGIARNPIWDWREYGIEPELIETLRTLKTEFSSVG